MFSGTPTGVRHCVSEGPGRFGKDRGDPRSLFGQIVCIYGRWMKGVLGPVVNGGKGENARGHAFIAPQQRDDTVEHWSVIRGAEAGDPGEA